MARRTVARAGVARVGGAPAGVAPAVVAPPGVAPADVPWATGARLIGAPADVVQTDVARCLGALAPRVPRPAVRGVPAAVQHELQAPRAVHRNPPGPATGTPAPRLREADGTDQRLDAILRPIPGIADRRTADHSARRTCPIPGRSRAPSAAQRHRAATSGRKRPASGGPRHRPAAVGTVAHRARQPGEVLRRSDALSAATRSKVAKLSGSSLRCAGVQCTRSG